MADEVARGLLTGFAVGFVVGGTVVVLIVAWATWRQLR